MKITVTNIAHNTTVFRAWKVEDFPSMTTVWGVPFTPTHIDVRARNNGDEREYTVGVIGTDVLGFVGSVSGDITFVRGDAIFTPSWANPQIMGLVDEVAQILDKDEETWVSAEDLS